MNAPETKDVIVAIARLLADLNNAKSDDGKVGSAECMTIVVSALPGIVQAFVGAGKIVDELKLLDKEGLDSLYYGFLETLNWQPDDNTRDKFAVVYDIVSAVVIGALKYHRTVSPPKAEVVAEAK